MELETGDSCSLTVGVVGINTSAADRLAGLASTCHRC